MDFNEGNRYVFKIETLVNSIDPFTDLKIEC